MSEYLKRLSYLISILKTTEYASDQLLELLQEKSFSVSQRQLQRDLKSLQDVLTEKESLKSYFLEGKKYFYIKKASKPNHKSTNSNSVHTVYTNFYDQFLDAAKVSTLEIIETAIYQKNTLEIELIKDDETGDNLDLDASQFLVCPIEIIYHRATYYVACYNLKMEMVEVYGVRQLVEIKLSKPFSDFKKLKKLVHSELKKRFGITKNIDNNVYDIEIEFTSATGRFIEDHHWHSSQKIVKTKGNYTLTMHCGINRELLGWLFQWMYNVKVIEPLFLKQLYEKALLECDSTHRQQTPFVYRNIFTKGN